MTKKVGFLTNAKAYVGPPAASALARMGWDVFSHDDSFTSSEARDEYERANPGCYASSASDPATFVAQGLERFGRIDALMSNDIPKLHGTNADPFHVVDSLDHFERLMDSLVLAPVRLLRAAIPTMKAARAGSIILITSGSPLRSPPMKGGWLGYTSGRAAANALAKSLAVDLAAHNVQVNAVAPYLVYSSSFFPSEIGAQDPKYMPLIKERIPMQRFGAPEEAGALISRLASGEMHFVSGQVIALSGGGC